MDKKGVKICTELKHKKARNQYAKIFGRYQCTACVRSTQQKRVTRLKLNLQKNIKNYLQPETSQTIRRLLTKRSRLKPVDIPDQLVELKTHLLTLKRAIRIAKSK